MSWFFLSPHQMFLWEQVNTMSSFSLQFYIYLMFCCFFINFFLYSSNIFHAFQRLNSKTANKHKNMHKSKEGKSNLLKIFGLPVQVINTNNILYYYYFLIKYHCLMFFFPLCKSVTCLWNFLNDIKVLHFISILCG